MGLGDNADLLYSVPVELGDRVFALHLDTGSSDLWVISDQCQIGACGKLTTGSRYPQSASGPGLSMSYGDSTTGTSANGTVGHDTASIAGISILDQPFGVVDATDNLVVSSGLSGIIGLGFPAASRVQEALTIQGSGPIHSTDQFLLSTFDDGPVLARIAMTNTLTAPMFSTTFQRNTIDIGGHGLLTLGKLPDGVKDSEMIWVPVRLYKPSEGGLKAPGYAPKEVYPYRWEIDIDAVYLDGEKVPDSTIKANGVDSTRVSAFMDTGNSIIRGPQDVVNNILTKVSSTYNPNDKNWLAELPCNVPHTLSFQIGGKLFPIDPRDFISQESQGNATTCKADNLVSTDPPSPGALFRWSLGAPFYNNVVAFHYGNLTHPSVDPPRIGILSTVPSDATQLLQAAVTKASHNGGNFPNTVDLPPTQSAVSLPKTTVTVSIPLPLQALKDTMSSAGSRYSTIWTSFGYEYRFFITPLLILTLSHFSYFSF
ncbi:aspartic peptidase domain-containing protein [Crepidotus variabilis]|uniref:Aspartic peptidase domain-containing protein n=1 Tax=Crepidotus variabilis TaxID=179855 RepID=A0A9P6JMB5_9AGAR|nr:aspartic peptidase domain-containing protein [Crepidotus variabilis]